MKPNVVLIKFNINPKWREKFLKAGIPQKTPDESALELKHMFHALEVGRDPYRFRQEKSDSGIPVFGETGAQFISINGLFQELRQAGYSPNGAHIKKREEKFNTLVIPFILEGKESISPQAASLTEEFLGVCWGHVHVWINPPQPETGAMVHTVNLSHRELEKTPEKTLRFNGGRWKTS
ncbi:MAG: hypothetical protein Q8M00_01970 [bacterium]|nr:hypothetical protein [bacterium]